jgi:ribulose 1,5-bisphosphate synthetase/thiazole synthase
MSGPATWLALVLLTTAPTVGAETVFQSPRQLPVVRQTDVVVVGGSLPAVAAAVQAAQSGASVLLVAPRTYVGDDLGGTLRLWLAEGAKAEGELTSRLFQDTRVTTPYRVKCELEQALLEAGVDFLLACYPTDVLRDAQDQLAGVVIANRAGRQAIVAKTIIDATAAATVARLAGEPVAEPLGPRLCQRMVLGGRGDSQVQPVRQVDAKVRASRGQKELLYYVYQQPLDVVAGDFGSWAHAEQQMRDLTYRSGQLRASERIQFLAPSVLPGDSEEAEEAENEASASPAPLAGSRKRLQVIGHWAQRPPAQGDQPAPHDFRESLGRKAGMAAARQAERISMSRDVEVSVATAPAKRQGDVRETLTGLRPVPADLPQVSSPAAGVPVLARADVVVVGGGTSGACAAIGAARRGASVLVIEYQEGLGGVGTLGLIGRPYHGMNRGFTAEVPFPNRQHNIEHKMEWFRQQIRKEGGTIWLGTLGCGVYVQDDRVRGAVVATPLGRGVVLAKVVIDATGNADLAVAAGAESMYGGDSTCIALQGAGLPRRPLSDSYVNTDYLLVDPADMVDTWRALVGVRLAGEAQAYDIGPFIQTRERRRVVGDHVLSYLDQIAGRTYSDSIVLSGSDYDSHGYPSEPYFALIPHTEKTLKANHPAPGGTCYTPYRCLLPRGVEGLLVTGLGISMLRDATALVRMQKDMHNQGYAAGVAAAMAAEDDCPPRAVDVKELQQHLVQVGNLPSEVLSHQDSFPLLAATVQSAVARYGDPAQPRTDRCQALAVILSHAETAGPMLLEAHKHSEGEPRLAYAKVLGFLGQRCVAPELIAALAEVDGWDPKILQGRMAEYAHLPTPVDALILALGHSGDAAALPVILQWLDRLDAQVTLSHHRAVALALEKLADPAAAEPLARLLSKPGMSGHAMTQLEPLYDRDRQRRRRTEPLREIQLARALYRCGDFQQQGRRILEQYRRDVRGLFARHAHAVLNAAP